MKQFSNQLWNSHYESTNVWRKQQHKEVRSLLDCEPEGITQNGIEQLFIDDELGVYHPVCYYQEGYYLKNS